MGGQDINKKYTFLMEDGKVILKCILDK